MKNILPLTIVLIVFLLGFIIGRITTDNGRYFYKIEKEQLAIFDSRTGIFYIKDNSKPKTTFFQLDVKNAATKDYKEKK